VKGVDKEGSRDDWIVEKKRKKGDCDEERERMEQKEIKELLEAFITLAPWRRRPAMEIIVVNTLNARQK
jgi:hypothetical protein